MLDAMKASGTTARGGRTRAPRATHAAKLRPEAVAGLLSVLLAACGSSSSGNASKAGGGADNDAGGAGAGADVAAPLLDASANDDVGDDGSGSADSGALDAADTAPPAPPDAAGARPDGGTVMSVYVTFYGWADNSPPGGAIAYPKSDGYPTLHETAGGTGTYADPITFATDKAEFPVGTILYVPFIEKYVIMEDDCVECDSDWTSSHKWHVDLWMNSDATETASSLVSCEDRWTRDSTAVEVSPPPDRVVTTTPLFTPATNTCRTTP
jgi:3D (Asp-Asp-Asp) domain-containing protein